MTGRLACFIQRTAYRGIRSREKPTDPSLSKERFKPAQNHHQHQDVP